MKKHIVLFYAVLISCLFSCGIFAQGMVHFSYKNDSYNTKNQPVAIETLGGNQALVFSTSGGVLDSLLFANIDLSGGIKDAPVLIATEKATEDHSLKICAVKTNTGRIVLVYTGESATKTTHSDDNGKTWSDPVNIQSSMSILYHSLSKDSSGKLWICGYSDYLFESEDNGDTWTPRKITVSAGESLIHFDSMNFVIFKKSDSYSISYTSSSDSSDTWSAETLICTEKDMIANPKAVIDKDGTVWLFYNIKSSTTFRDIYQYDIFYRKSSNRCVTWSDPVRFTRFAGNDFNFSVSLFNGTPYLSFISNRNNGKYQIWMGQPGQSEDLDTPPVIYDASPYSNYVRAYAASDSPVSSVSFLADLDGSNKEFPLYDDGLHRDYEAGDNIWGGEVKLQNSFNQMNYKFLAVNAAGKKYYSPGVQIISYPELKAKWMSAGSLNNWYSSYGTERETEIESQEQSGMQWPAIYDNQDAQCARMLWIGVKDFYSNGSLLPYKVIKRGPRVANCDDYLPVKFYMKSRYPAAKVVVNGTECGDADQQAIDSIDSSMPWDREIYNELNTSVGLTIKRRIIQFSQQFNDNYIISEYTFTNTGNTDLDSDIELQDNTLNDIRIFMGYRFAMIRESRNFIGHSSGWGVNTTIDTRGDGLYPDPAGEDMRAQFAWPGKYVYSDYPKGYENLGSPCFTPASPIDKADSTGRLVSPQFVGVATLHADRSAYDKSDDTSQPSLTNTFSGDGDLTYVHYNDKGDYQFISGGHDKRHLEKIGERVSPYSLLPKKDPSTGSTINAGYDFGNGYGPYTLKHGESIKLVLVEAAAGLSREKAAEYGSIYKNSLLSAKSQADFDSANIKKNKAFFTGKDSLFQTFRRARANYNSNWNIQKAPCPPSEFKISTGTGEARLSWNLFDESDPEIKGFVIYRALKSESYVFKKIAELPADARAYADTLFPEKTNGCRYYISSIGAPIEADPALNIPASNALSNPIYTVTMQPVSITTDVKSSSIKKASYRLYENYPNPFNPSTVIRYSIGAPGRISLKVYDILGKQVSELVNEHRDSGEYSAIFNAQSLPSGIYFYELRCNGYSSAHKMVLVK